jgi:hypothetical protein
MIRSLAHLAFFAAVYVAAAVVCAAQLTGAHGALTPDVLFYAWCTALLAYLLDRVKLRDAWLDPADRLAHPGRYAFLFSHRRAARLLMAGAGVMSLVSGWLLHPIAAAGTLATIAGVLLYAGRPRAAAGGCPRVKDRFVIKNLFVGAGIAGFAALIVCPGRGAAWGRRRRWRVRCGVGLGPDSAPPLPAAPARAGLRVPLAPHLRRCGALRHRR